MVVGEIEVVDKLLVVKEFVVGGIIEPELVVVLEIVVVSEIAVALEIAVDGCLVAACVAVVVSD